MRAQADGSSASGSPVRDRAARAFVWSAWLLMALVGLICLARYGRNVPLTEDWQLVPALTGNEPHLLQSLWAQNNEHRIPFPKLVLLGLLKLANGDFRVGMAFNIALLAATAAALVHLARWARGGVTRYADALFPIGLLHLGHWDNLFWGWQATQIIPTLLVLCLLYQIVRDPSFETASSIAWGTTALLLLPLSGANGLLFAPFFACWFAYCGLRLLREDAPTAESPRRTAFALIGAAGVTLALTGLYFVGYERPTWVPPNPGLRASVVAAIQFGALGLGPIARSSWTLSVAAALLVLVSSAAVAGRAALIERGWERHRALGMLVFVLSFSFFILAMGWGRAGVIAVDQTWPGRYSLFAFPAYVGAFFLWQLYGGPVGRAVILNGMLAGMLFLIPLNASHGIWFRDWYLMHADAVLHDLQAGTTSSELAAREGSFLNHAMDPTALDDQMRMLQHAGVFPWQQLRERTSSPASSAPSGTAREDELLEEEVRYHRQGAAEVILVWGIDGWQSLDEGLLPEGTVIRDGLMRTRMVGGEGDFVGKILAPPGSNVNYGFLTTRDATGAETESWDGDFAPVAVAAGAVIEQGMNEVLDRDTDVEPDGDSRVTRAFSYRLPGAGEVFLIWGVDGWHTVPDAIEPGRTVIEGQLMRTSMDRDGDVFTASVRVPEGATMDYGFLTTDRRGILDLVQPHWDPRESYANAVTDGQTIEIEASDPLPDEWAEARSRWRIWLVGLLLLLGTWALSYFALGLRDVGRSRSAIA